MPLYEVAILEKPSKKAAEAGETEKLVFGPEFVVARDAQSAIVAAFAQGQVPQLDPNNAEVLVRPFVDSAGSLKSTGSAPITQYDWWTPYLFAQMVYPRQRVYTTTAGSTSACIGGLYGIQSCWNVC